MMLKNIFNCGRTQARNNFIKQEERKAMRWLICERRNNLSPLFSQEEFTAIRNRVDEEFKNNEILKRTYPKIKEREEVSKKMMKGAAQGIDAILSKFIETRGDVLLYNMNVPSQKVLPFALLRDEAQQELEAYMDNIIKDGRTTITQAEYEKYKELKNKVDELENSRLDALKEMETYREANKEIVKSKGIEEEYNFLFNTEPLSDEFYEKYFPYMKISK